MKIGIVGLGYWGPNLVRNFLSTDGVEVVICFDVSERNAARTKKRFPMVELAASYSELLQRSDVDAVVLATPVSTHYSLGIQALKAGKHLLVEKPLTTKAAEAIDLINEAERRDIVLMVDHTFIYTGAVRKIRELADYKLLGDIMYFDSVRVNLGLFQHDINVIWDLAAHDISIMDHILDVKPIAVSAFGATHFNGVADMAYLTARFENNLIAHFHVNWLSPVKIRRILIGGTKLMIVYDDMDPSDKVKVYDKGVDINGQESIHSTLVQYRTGDMFAPRVDLTEALSLVAAEFVDCIKSHRRPVTDGQAGLNVVRVLEAADASLQQGGRIIELANASI
jgi:predicted dehydrogenase